jgi:hypothetical protein
MMPSVPSEPMRDLPADETGIAALRHDRGACFVGAGEDRGDLLRRGGLQHERRLAVIAVTPFDEIRRHGIGIANSVLVADDARERIQRLGRRGARRFGHCRRSIAGE